MQDALRGLVLGLKLIQHLLQTALFLILLLEVNVFELLELLLHFVGKGITLLLILLFLFDLEPFKGLKLCLMSGYLPLQVFIFCQKSISFLLHLERSCLLLLSLLLNLHYLAFVFLYVLLLLFHRFFHLLSLLHQNLIVLFIDVFSELMFLLDYAIFDCIDLITNVLLYPLFSIAIFFLAILVN